MNKKMFGYARSGHRFARSGKAMTKPEKNKTLLTAVLALVFFAMAPLVSRAQEPVPVQPALPEALAAAPSPVNCFDYYKFQSVQVSLGTDKDAYALGEAVSLQGELINQNDYPVVDGNVFARISEKNPQYQSQGQFIIDEKILDTDVNLDAKERKKVAYQWMVPEGVKKGEYRVDFFFSVGKKFNLGGLPFTNEIIVGSADFQIKSNSNATIFFDKSKTTVDGKKYNHIGNWPSIEANQRVEIIQPIKNTFNEARTVEVQYDLYFWDSLNEKDKISTETKEIVVPADGSVDLKYAIAQMKDSVYMLKITAVSGDYKSIVNIRLTSDQQHARLNYPAITKFPISEGDNFSLFSCFHNTSWSDAEGSVQLALYDKKGKLVDKMEYQGAITGAMMADKKDITAKDNYDYFQLKAQILDKDKKVIDEYETVYDCQKINSEVCKQMLSQKKTTEAASEKISNIKTIIVLIVLALVLISTLVVSIVRIKNKKTAAIIFLCFMVSIAVLGGGKAEAKYERSGTQSVNSNFQRLYNTKFIFGDGKNIVRLQFNYFINILHKAEMTEGDLIINISDPLEFIYSPEVSFNLTGTSWDSPYGTWIDDWPNFDQLKIDLKSRMEKRESIDNYMTLCRPGSFVEGGGIDCSKFWVYVTYFAHTNELNMVSSDSDIVECFGMSCVAKKPGNATLTATTSFMFRPAIFYRNNINDWEFDWTGSEIVSLSYIENEQNPLRWDITVLPNASCTGVDPTNATLCVGDDQGLIGDISKTVVSSCTTATKCEYTCNAGHIFSEGMCKVPQAPPPPPVAARCGGSCPVNSKENNCGGDEQGAGSWHAVGSCTASNCECKCDTGYVFNASTSTCERSGTPAQAVSGKTYCQLPTDRTQLCSSGTATGIKLETNNGVTKWTWICVGSDNASVSGSAVKDCSWTEVNP